MIFCNIPLWFMVLIYLSLIYYFINTFDPSDRSHNNNPFEINILRSIPLFEWCWIYINRSLKNSSTTIPLCLYKYLLLTYYYFIKIYDFYYIFLYLLCYHEIITALLLFIVLDILFTLVHFVHFDCLALNSDAVNDYKYIFHYAPPSSRGVASYF